MRSQRLRKNRQINIKLPRCKQKIIVGNNLQEYFFDEVRKREYFSTVLFVDPRIKKLYHDFYKRVYRKLKPTVVIEVNPHEKSKSLRFLDDALKECYGARINRNSGIVAIGGGIVGDVAGFLASVYMRGVDFIYLPTTLMAQGDSIVNKVAISFRSLKNILGSFYSPSLTICDTKFLKTLSRREFSLGMSEIIKHALITKSPLLSLVQKSFRNDSFAEFKKVPWEDIIYYSLRVKIKMVRSDPIDRKGQQKALSYGHTFANALEGISKYNLRHGEAVALGMRLAGIISNSRGILSNRGLQLQNNLLDKAGLPKKLPANTNPDRIINMLHDDKLSTDGRIALILLRQTGKYEVVYGILKDEIRAALLKL